MPHNLGVHLDHLLAQGGEKPPKEAISKVASYFNSQRMMRRYDTEAYIR